MPPALLAALLALTLLARGAPTPAPPPGASFPVLPLAGSPVAAFADGAGAAARFTRPAGVALLPPAALFQPAVLIVADSNRVRAVSLATAAVATLAGGGAPAAADGAAPNASFAAPSGAALAGGVLYITDANLIRAVDAATGLTTTFAGNATPLEDFNVYNFADGVGLAARFLRPYAAAPAPGGGALVIADAGNNCIRRVDLATRAVTTLAGGRLLPGFVDATGRDAEFNQPRGIAVDPSGVAYVADASNFAIRAVSPAGAVRTLVGGFPGSADGAGEGAQFRTLAHVALFSGGLVVADPGNGCLRAVSFLGLATTLACVAPANFSVVGLAADGPLVYFSSGGGDAGTFVAGATFSGVALLNTTAPAPCPGGFFCAGGSAPALPCPAGNFCPPAASAPRQCAAGFWCAARAAAEALCAPGRWGAAGATDAACSGPCEAGFFCRPPATSAEAEVCPFGFLCPAGSAEPAPCPCAGVCGSTGLAAPTGTCLATPTPQAPPAAAAAAAAPVDTTLGPLAVAGVAVGATLAASAAAAVAVLAVLRRSKAAAGGAGARAGPRAEAVAAANPLNTLRRAAPAARDGEDPLMGDSGAADDPARGPGAAAADPAATEPTEEARAEAPRTGALPGAPINFGAPGAPGDTVKLVVMSSRSGAGQRVAVAPPAAAAPPVAGAGGAIGAPPAVVKVVMTSSGAAREGGGRVVVAAGPAPAPAAPAQGGLSASASAGSYVELPPLLRRAATAGGAAAVQPPAAAVERRGDEPPAFVVGDRVRAYFPAPDIASVRAYYPDVSDPESAPHWRPHYAVSKVFDAGFCEIVCLFDGPRAAAERVAVARLVKMGSTRLEAIFGEAVDCMMDIIALDLEISRELGHPPGFEPTLERSEVPAARRIEPPPLGIIAGGVTMRPPAAAEAAHAAAAAVSATGGASAGAPSPPPAEDDGAAARVAAAASGAPGSTARAAAAAGGATGGAAREVRRRPGV